MGYAGVSRCFTDPRKADRPISAAPISAVNRFTIRPNGVVSKKLIGAPMTLYNMELCITLPIWTACKLEVSLAIAPIPTPVSYGKRKKEETVTEGELVKIKTENTIRLLTKIAANM